MMEWGAAITAIVTLLLAVAKWYAANQPKRDQEQQNEATQQGRLDIANGDVAAVNGRIDRVLSVPEQTGSADSASGQHDSGDLLRRTQSVTGANILPDRTGSTSTTVGESRT